MQHEAPTHKFLVSMPSALPIAAFVLVGAGVAIAQPLEKRMAASLAQSDLSAPPLSAATIRIVLPPPTDMTRSAARKPQGPVRISLDDLAPAPVALMPQPVLPPSSLLPPLVERGTGEHEAHLAPLMSEEKPDFSATMREISESFGSAPIAPMDTALASMSGVARTNQGPSPTEPRRPPTRAAQPSETAQDLVGSKTGRDDPLGHSDHAQAILTDIMKPKPRSIPSVSLQVSTTVNGTAAGRVLLLINDAENISVRLRDLLAILQPELGPAAFERLSASQAAQTYMTLNELRSSGIAATFDDRDRLVLTTPREAALPSQSDDKGG